MPMSKRNPRVYPGSIKSAVWVEHAGVFVLLSGTLIVSYMIPNRHPEPLLKPLSSIDSQIASWNASGPDEELNSRQLIATSYLARTYEKKSYKLTLLVAFHDSHQAAVSIHSPKNCLPGEGWEMWKTGSPQVMWK